MRRETRRVPMVLGVLCVLLSSQGCGRPTTIDADEPAPPFTFRALDLQQRTRQGLPAWSLKSPEARYDLRSSVARALKPEGIIFEKGQPLYTLAASTGTVINDGAVILLEGDIRLQRLGKDPILLTADRVLWIPQESLMRFEVRPSVRNLQTQLSAETATLQIDEDRLNLRGAPTLKRWSRPIALNAQPSDQTPEIDGTFQEVEWRPSQGDLKAQGPVSFTRRPPGRAPHLPSQLLKGSRLEGNTVRQDYTLIGPVDFTDPAERYWFRGGDVLVNTKTSQLNSKTAFQGQKADLQVQGEEFQLDGKGTMATIARNCQLQQKGDQLNAQRCQWNWKTQAFSADGQVVYRRTANGQLTRAERMEGRLGPDGEVKATSPGGRVFSQLRVPRQAATPKPVRTPSKPNPIEF